jgi:hypothetical protein
VNYNYNEGTAVIAIQIASLDLGEFLDYDQALYLLKELTEPPDSREVVLTQERIEQTPLPSKRKKFTSAIAEVRTM